MFVLLMFFYFILFLFNFFSRATVGAVLQPCRTCHMLRATRCVLGKYMMMMMTATESSQS